MKRLLMLILLVIVLPEYLMAQQLTEYNRKGDEAMKRQDYSDARMWYEEGIANCDSYSIRQLTAIGEANKKQHASMRSLMTRCLNCLTVKATDNDSTAVAQLIVYYNEGIGTPVSEELAGHWIERLESLRKPVESKTYIPKTEKKPREPMRFFVGYTFSIEAPYGLTIGGVGKRIGWYARFKTNMAFDNYTNECKGTDELINVPDNESFQFTNHKKKTSLAASAGLVVKCTSRLYTSIGLGYGKRELLCEYTTTDKNNSALHNSYWAKNLDHSYEGVTAELDLMVKLGPVYVSAGCNTLNFKYVDLNAGLGLFF